MACRKGNDSLSRWHTATYLSMMMMTRGISKEAIITMIDGEKSKGTKDIFDEEQVMNYLKHREPGTTMLAKVKD